MRAIMSGVLRSDLRRSAVGSMVSGLASQTALVVSGVLSARILGAQGRGLLALLILFPVLIALLGALGLPQAVTHFVSRTKRPYEIYRLLRSVVAWQVLLLIPVHVAVLVAYTQGKSLSIQYAAWVTTCVIPAILAQQYGLAILQGKGNYRSFNILRAIPAFLYAAIISCLFLAGCRTLLWVSGAWTAAVILAGLMTLIVAQRALQSSHGSEDVGMPTTREMIVFGLKGLVGWSSPLDSFRVDQLFAGLILSPTMLGYYVVAQALTNLPKFLAQSVGMVAFPSISGRILDPSVPSLIRRFVAVVGILSAVMVLGLALGAPWIIGFFFGPSFLPAAPIARILLIGSWLLALRRILVECLRGLGYPTASTYSELSLYPCLGILVFFMLAPLDIEKLAIGVTLSQGVALAVAAVLMVRLQPSIMSNQ